MTGTILGSKKLLQFRGHERGQDPTGEYTEFLFDSESVSSRRGRSQGFPGARSQRLVGGTPQFWTVYQFTGLSGPGNRRGLLRLRVRDRFRDLNPLPRYPSVDGPTRLPVPVTGSRRRGSRRDPSGERGAGRLLGPPEPDCVWTVRPRAPRESGDWGRRPTLGVWTRHPNPRSEKRDSLRWDHQVHPVHRRQ